MWLYIFIIFILASIIGAITGSGWEAFKVAFTIFSNIFRFIARVLEIIVLGVLPALAFLWFIFKRRVSQAAAKAYLNAQKLAVLEENVAQRNPALWNGGEAGTRRVLTIGGEDFAFRYCPADDCERNCGDFWIAETPTTQAQWDAVGGRKAKSSFFGGMNLSVGNVELKECVDYIDGLNSLGVTPEGWRFDLPSSEQWEYACRVGSSDPINCFVLNDHAEYKANEEDVLYEAGTNESNKRGVLDMLDFVWKLIKSKGGTYENASNAPDDKLNKDVKKRRSRVGFRLILARL